MHNIKNLLTNNTFVKYILRFLFLFFVFYFATIAVIGITSPGGYYSPFIDKYLDYISLLRTFLLHGAKYLLLIIGYDVSVQDGYLLKIQNNIGARIVYSCLGYGVMSFWMAFVIANRGSFWKKIKWVAGGLLAICIINIFRISFLLIAINKQWRKPFGLDHHDLFNIAAYSCIFIMIYYFEKSDKKLEQQ